MMARQKVYLTLWTKIVYNEGMTMFVLKNKLFSQIHDAGDEWAQKKSIL